MRFCGCAGCGVTITGVGARIGAAEWFWGVGGCAGGAGVGMRDTEGFSGVPESQSSAGTRCTLSVMYPL